MPSNFDQLRGYARKIFTKRDRVKDRSESGAAQDILYSRKNVDSGKTKAEIEAAVSKITGSAVRRSKSRTLLAGSCEQLETGRANRGKVARQIAMSRSRGEADTFVQDVLAEFADVD